MNQKVLTARFRADWATFAASRGLGLWEAWYAPYDESVYNFVLERLAPDDVVLDIGAGDFRFALAASGRARKVYAVEVHSHLVADFLHRAGERLPPNLLVVCANALDLPVPPDVTTGVLLVRHTVHFRDFFEKLRAAGARRLFTNARWHLAVEEVDLQARRVNFDSAPPGWYACACGAVGFKEPESPDFEITDEIHEVVQCPHCRVQKEQTV